MGIESTNRMVKHCERGLFPRGFSFISTEMSLLVSKYGGKCIQIDPEYRVGQVEGASRLGCILGKSSFGYTCLAY